jgi:hypothetical protein
MSSLYHMHNNNMYKNSTLKSVPSKCVRSDGSEQIVRISVARFYPLDVRGDEKNGELVRKISSLKQENSLTISNRPCDRNLGVIPECKMNFAKGLRPHSNYSSTSFHDT